MEDVPDINELLSSRSIKMEVVQNANAYTITSNGVIETDILPSDPGCIINHFDSESDLEMMQAQVEILHSPTLIELEDMAASQDSQVISTEMQQLDNEDDVIVQLMDIRTRLSKLRETLEQRVGSDLSDFEFWLQDSKMLESHKTLVDQCIRGEGVVQVNIQLKAQEKRINILDVLKPDDDCHVEGLTLHDDLNLDKVQTLTKDPEEFINEEMIEMQDVQEERSDSESTPVKGIPDVNASPPKWMVDEQFKADRIRLKIPEESSNWTVAHVRHWIMWAVRQFNLVGVKLSDWLISGAEMKTMNHNDFKKKCPHDPGEIFWTHFELLRKCKFVAIVQNEDPNIVEPVSVVQTAIKKKHKAQEHVNVITHPDGHTTMPMRFEIGEDDMLNPVIRSGNNGQVQLWQFLLELLTSAEHTMVIEWLGSEGEFRLCNPDMVARLWGIKKNKPAMNYEKLSRALRYYYDGDMIAKVHGQRFVYKFVCDLKQLIGYDAADLSRLVNQSALALQLSDNSRDTSMTTPNNYW